jgi:hypothetical protein
LDEAALGRPHMSDDNVIDFARYRAFARSERTREEWDAWAGEIEDRALNLYTRTLREPFTGFCTAVFDRERNRRYIFIGYHYESRVVAKYNIGTNDRLTRAKPTKRDDKLLQRHRAGFDH